MSKKEPQQQEEKQFKVNIYFRTHIHKKIHIVNLKKYTSLKSKIYLLIIFYLQQLNSKNNIDCGK